MAFDSLASTLRQQQHVARHGGEERDVKDFEAKKVSLRQQMHYAKQAARNVQANAKAAVANVVNVGVKGTAWALRISWQSLILTWGATIFIIDLIVLLNAILGDKIICRLGDEWTPPGLGKTGQDAAKNASRGIRFVEMLVFLFVNLLVWGMVLGLLAIFIKIAEFYSANIIDKVKMIYSLGWSAIKEIFYLFW